VAVLVTLATLLALVWFGVEQAMMLASNETPMLRISAAWGVAALPVGAALSCLHILRHVLEHGVGETLWPADPVAAVEESHVA
jgi:TRAP-type C4-dicarboxylate transport system permease small subunit